MDNEKGIRIWRLVPIPAHNKKENTMTKQQTQEAIKVMQAYADGQDIEYRSTGAVSWYNNHSPIWDWPNYNYRIAKPKPVNLAVGMILRRSFNAVLDIKIVAIADNELCYSCGNGLAIHDIGYIIAHYQAAINGKLHDIIAP
jgi:hypothetical protein